MLKAKNEVLLIKCDLKRFKNEAIQLKEQLEDTLKQLDYHDIVGR